MTPVMSAVSSNHSIVSCSWFTPELQIQLRFVSLQKKKKHTAINYFWCLMLTRGCRRFPFHVCHIITCDYLLHSLSQAAVALQEVGWKEVYPMDFYSNQSLGPWAPNHPDNQPARPTRRQVRRGQRK